MKEVPPSYLHTPYTADTGVVSNNDHLLPPQGKQTAPTTGGPELRAGGATAWGPQQG